MQLSSETANSDAAEHTGIAWRRYLERRQRKGEAEWQERRRMIARQNQPRGRGVTFPQIRIADTEDTAFDIASSMAPRWTRGQFSSVDSSETGASSRSSRANANAKAQADRLMAAPAAGFLNKALAHRDLDSEVEDASFGSCYRRWAV
mmetsp:Transcript_87468/g.252208  ORF Transcript_87468/g.252208 Transcript_87468/m.252208 type:complete len:148 (-) Transcript_87468:223-666(-)